MANIFKRAAQLRRAHPRKYKTQKQAVRAASKLMRKSRKGKKVSGSVSRRRKSKGSNRVDISMGSVSSHKSAIARILDKQIDSAVVRRHRAGKKTEKRKLTRRIHELQSQRKKFC